jgi:hypothetical protein
VTSARIADARPAVVSTLRLKPPISESLRDASSSAGTGACIIRSISACSSATTSAAIRFLVCSAACNKPLGPRGSIRLCTA